MSLRPIIRNNPISHVHDHPLRMDIWDFHKEHHLPMPQVPFHNHTITPLAGHSTCSGVEWRETPDAQVLVAEIPAGLGKDDIKVRVEEGKVLKISGKKEVKKEEMHENWHQFERSKGRFVMAVSLPENCRHDHVRSSLENGVLTVRVPKRDVKKSHAKSIEVHG